MMPKLSGFDVCERAKHDARPDRRLHRPAHRQGAGVRSAERPGGRRRPLHDQAVRSRRAAAEGARRARTVSRHARVALKQVIGRQQDARALVDGARRALGAPVSIEDARRPAAARRRAAADGRRALPGARTTRRSARLGVRAAAGRRGRDAARSPGREGGRAQGARRRGAAPLSRDQPDLQLLREAGGAARRRARRARSRCRRRGT